MAQGQRPGLDGPDGSGTEEGAGRYYMNKIFGRGLEKARALEEEMQAPGKPGTVMRAMIEPDQDGGQHRVTIESHTMTMRSGQRGGKTLSSTEHMFTNIEEAIRFLDDVLHGRPANEDDADGGKEEQQRGTGAEDGGI